MDKLLERLLKEEQDPNTYRTEVEVHIIGEYDEIITSKVTVEWRAVLDHKKWGIKGVDISVVGVEEISYKTLDGQEHVIDIPSESVSIDGEKKFPLGPTDIEISIDKDNKLVAVRLEF